MREANTDNTAIIIANYNHGEHLTELIRQINKYFEYKKIYVIDDKSTDNSVEIIKNIPINIFVQKKNKGKGGALKTGFKHAIEDGFEYAITIDADLQHNPDSLMKFIEKQKENNSQLVIGSREISRKKMPFMRVMSNKITSKIVSFLVHQKITDSQSGYRLYDLKSFNIENLLTDRYQFETEIVFEIVKNGGKIDSIPIETIYSGQTSHISHLRDIKYFIDVVLEYWKKRKWRKN